MQASDSTGAIDVLVRPRNAIPLAVGGLPSPDSVFAIHCVAEIVRRTRGDAMVVPFNIGEDRECLDEASADHPIVPFFDAPDIEARQLLLATEAPIVIVTGHFPETARFCMHARGMEALQAARFVSQSFSCLEPFRRSSRVRWLTIDRAATPAHWIDEVAAWLELQPSAWQDARAQMLAEYAAWPTVEAAIHALVPSALAASVDGEDVPLATRTLFETLGTSYHSGSMDALFWPADSIFEYSASPHPVTGAIALTGPTRVVTSGPYLHLPPGHWRARYQFEADDHPVGNLIEFDILHAGKIQTSGRTMIDEAGKFGFDCEFDVEDPRLSVEYRAILAEGSIGGWFNPIGIWLTRDPASRAPKDVDNNASQEYSSVSS